METGYNKQILSRWKSNYNSLHPGDYSLNKSEKSRNPGTLITKEIVVEIGAKRVATLLEDEVMDGEKKQIYSPRTLTRIPSFLW